MNKSVASNFVRQLAPPGAGQGLAADEDQLDRIVASTGAPQRVYPTKQEERPLNRTPRSAWSRTTIDLPLYLIDEIRITGAQRRVTASFLFMQALKAAGSLRAELEII